MKRIFFYFLLLTLFLSVLSSASLGLDKGKLDFNIFAGEEQCNSVTLSSNNYYGLIEVRDEWSGEDISKIYGASNYDLSISYIDTIVDFEDEVEFEVCISGLTPGDYKGALIFTPEAEGKVNVEIGTWLLVNIEEKPQQPSPSENNPVSNSNSGSGGGGSSGKVNLQVNAEKDSDSVSTGSPLKNDLADNEIKQLSGENQKVDANPSITGNAINENGGSVHYIIPIVFVIIAVLGFFHFRNKRKRAFGYQFITP